MLASARLRWTGACKHNAPATRACQTTNIHAGKGAPYLELTSHFEKFNSTNDIGFQMARLDKRSNHEFPFRSEFPGMNTYCNYGLGGNEGHNQELDVAAARSA